ncbi:MAG: HD-GYP domain-containing protein [Actinomycetota bacterium]
MAGKTTNTTPQWVARPGWALLLRVALTLGPIIAVTAAAWQVHLTLGSPSTFISGVARWVALSATCTIAIRLLDRFAKKLLPLTVLLRMTIVFPDDVPSRFRVALRYGTTRQLERDVESGALRHDTPQEAAERLLALVARLSAHDRATRGHTERVRAYADLVAEQLGYSDDERHKLHWAGLLHDIGKLAVPAAVLNKKGPLTEHEWEQVRRHPEAGWELVQPLRAWLGEWAEATLDHHERWDGAGYPQGLAGSEISRGGRIISVVDAFDVMTSARSYKEPISFDAARSELAAASGSHFDPDVVRAFLALSLTKRRTQWSVLSWFANSPIITSVTSGGASVPASVATGMVAATVAAGSMVVSGDSPNPEPIEVALERAIESTTTTTISVAPTVPVTTTAPTTTTAPPTTAPPTTVITATPPTTIAPTTTAAPTTTTAPPATTVPPPTTTAPTTTTVPPPTTTVAVDAIDNSYLGGGLGDVLNLVDTVDGAAVADLDGDPNPGLTIARSSDGLIEIDDPNVHAWRFSTTNDTQIQGNVFLRLHAAIENFDDGFAVLLVGLVACDSPAASCTELLSGQGAFAQVGFGSDFGAVEVDLGSIDTTVPAGKHILITIAVATSSTHDVWLQFGSSAFPSQLLVN